MSKELVPIQRDHWEVFVIYEGTKFTLWSSFTEANGVHNFIYIADWWAATGQEKDTDNFTESNMARYVAYMAARRMCGEEDV